MKGFVGFTAVCILAASSATMGEEKTVAGQASAPASVAAASASDLVTRIGKIVKEEKSKIKDGKEIKTAKYMLVEKDGAKSKLKPKDAPTIDIEKFVGKDVKVVGEGEIETDHGVKTIDWDRIVSIEVMAK